MAVLADIVWRPPLAQDVVDSDAVGIVIVGAAISARRRDIFSRRP
jgi:hypothetical protein